MAPVTRVALADAASADHGEDCVLDLVHLSRQTLGERALEIEVLELFDRQAAGILARLAGPGGVRGAAGADLVHMLKGSARAVGAFAVAGAAEQLEEALRTGAAPDTAFGRLDTAVTAARRTVAALLH